VNLRDAAELWRQRAAASIDHDVWATSHALTAAERSESDKLMLRALTEPPTPETQPPPWSQVSREGESEGPIPF
jgi:hypothetical protein